MFFVSSAHSMASFSGDEDSDYMDNVFDIEETWIEQEEPISELVCV